MKTKFWNFNQNNSGGYFVQDHDNGVCEIVIIEAKTADEAWRKLNDIGKKVDGFWEYCSCCGDRWGNYFDHEGEDVPMHYGKPLDEVRKDDFTERAFVHYYDGTIKEYKFNEM